MTILRHIDDILHTSTGLGHKIGAYVGGIKSGLNPLSWGNLKHTNTELLGPKLGEHSHGHSEYHNISQNNPDRVARTLSSEEYNKFKSSVITPHNLGVKTGGSVLAGTTGVGLSGLEDTSKPPEIVSNISKDISKTSNQEVATAAASGVGGYALYRHLKNKKKKDDS
jgi:hypothetical protein